MMTTEWKTFEELTHRIQTELSPNAKVTLNDRVLGMESGKKRQVDRYSLVDSGHLAH